MSDQKGAPQVEEPYPLSTLRHSVSHLMASAIEKLYPGVKFGFGPSIEHGFYYDFDLEEPLEEKDLKKIEKEMRRIAKKAGPLTCTEYTRDQARARLAQKGQTYKVEAVDLIPEDEAITFYSHGDWEDLCEGPHISSFGEHEFHFKLLSVAGAYWRGDENREMLTRIYGTAWPEAWQLKEHKRRMEEAKKRDHRLLGKKLDLFSIQEQAGGGLCFWHPRGARVRGLMEQTWKDLHEKGGCGLGVPRCCGALTPSS